MKVADVMTPKLHVLTPTSTFKDAAHLFRENKIDGAPVVDEGVVIGLITKSHLYQAIDEEMDFNSSVAGIMTRSVTTINADEDVEVLYDLGRSRLPVLRENKAIGMITKSDINSIYNLKLKDMSNELETVLDSTYNAILCIDDKFNIKVFNRAAESIFEMKREQVVGKPYHEIFPEGPLAEIIRSGSTQKSQKLIFKNRTLVANRTPIMVDGKVAGAVAVVQDISDLESLANQLQLTRQLKEKMDAVIEASLDSIFVTDSDGRVINVNEAYTRMTGIKAEEILGKTMYELVEKGYYNRAATIMVLESQQPVSYTEKTRTGKTALFIGTPIFNQEGDLVNVLVNIHDITELESVSEELDYTKQLKDELDAVIEGSFDGIFITDADARVERVNEAYIRVSGIDRREIIGRSMYELIEEGYYNKSASIMVIESHKPVTFTQKTKTGKTLLVTGNPIFDEKGKLVRVVTNTRDLTELKKLQQEVEHAHGLSRHYQEELRKINLQKNGVYIVKSQKSKDIFDLILRLGRVDSTVLIQGESGVGKEIVAQELHNNSLRRNKPFIRVNCGAIPENLLESELFGYDPGAFTGARKDGKMGIFELANGGNLFLDEVAELPLQLQVKLLRVIQEKEITRLGGTTPIKVDVRIIAATNRDLKAMVRKGQFRADLFYRLNVVPIFVPPLRERKEEIPDLANLFLDMFNKKYGLDKVIDKHLLDNLMDYQWPGNVRELRNAIERAVVTSPDRIIREIKFSYLNEDQEEKITFSTTPYINLKDTMEAYEKELIAKYIRNYGSSRKTAAALAISQTTVWRKANQYGIPLKDQ